MKILTIASTLILTALAFTAQARPFTSTDGKVLEAEIQSVAGDKVTIIRSDNRTFTVPISTFIEEDKKYITEWQKKDQENRIPRIDMRVTSGRSDQSAKNGDYDDRKMKLGFKVEVENRERNFNIDGAKATLVVLGEDVLKKGRLKVLSKETYNFSAPEGRTSTHEAKPVQLNYDDNDAAQYGHKYYGYVLVVQNKGGKTIATKSIPSGLAKYGDAALKIRQGATTNRELN